jgi:hypothetical protein
LIWILTFPASSKVDKKTFNEQNSANVHVTNN